MSHPAGALPASRHSALPSSSGPARAAHRIFDEPALRRLREELRVNSPVPMHQRTFSAVAEVVRSGSPGSGETLPSQQELCAYLIISRSTLLTALRRLVKEGLIDAGPGAITSFPEVPTSDPHR